MCVTSLCLCGTTHTHTHRNGVAKTSICQINNPWRIKHTLEYERILLGGFFLMLIDILDLYSHITVYRTLASAVFFLQTEAHLHSHTLMISIAAICTPRCNQATSLCSTVLWDTPGKCAENVNTEASVRERLQRAKPFFFFKNTHKFIHLLQYFPPDGSWCFSALSCVRDS